MSIVNPTECTICNNKYDTDTRKPCIGTCSHSICENCKDQMVSTKCPQCNQEESFAVTTINLQALELIKNFKSMQTKPSIQWNDPRYLDEGTCSECTLESRKLRLCIPCAVKAGVLRHNEDIREFVLNVENIDIETALKRAKEIAICADCELNGVQHEGHKCMALANLNIYLEGTTPITVEEKVKQMEQ